MYAIRSYYGPGDADAIEGGGAPADLVHEDQAVLRGAMEDAGGLGHFHHEGGAAAGQIIRGSYPGEYLIHRADLRRHGRHCETTARITSYNVCYTKLLREGHQQQLLRIDHFGY